MVPKSHTTQEGDSQNNSEDQTLFICRETKCYKCYHLYYRSPNIVQYKMCKFPKPLFGCTYPHGVKCESLLQSSQAWRPLQFRLVSRSYPQCPGGQFSKAPHNGKIACADLRALTGQLARVQQIGPRTTWRGRGFGLFCSGVNWALTTAGAKQRKYWFLKAKSFPIAAECRTSTIPPTLEDVCSDIKEFTDFYTFFREYSTPNARGR